MFCPPIFICREIKKETIKVPSPLYVFRVFSTHDNIFLSGGRSFLEGMIDYSVVYLIASTGVPSKLLNMNLTLMDSQTRELCFRELSRSGSLGFCICLYLL